MLSSRAIAVKVVVVCFLLTSKNSFAQASFTISASQSNITVTQGNSISVSLSVATSGGFNSDLALAATGLAGCATTSFNPQPFKSPYSGGSTLTVTTNSTCSAATYPVTITASGGGVSQSTAINLTVQQAAGNQPTSVTDTLKNNFGFGVALGLSANVTGPNIVNNATIDANGIVRVNTRANTAAGFMLETHYYIWPKVTAAMLAGTQPDNRGWGTGPFVAAQPGSNQIISAVGAGWMIGFRRPKGSTPSGFGLGVGYEAIPAAQVLGSEFVDGQKAPLGPNGQPLPIRYETEDKGAALFVLSVAF